MANAIVDTLIFNGSIAGSASIQAQGIAGNLTFQLPNTPPIQGQIMTATAINGTTVVMGWSSAQSLSNIPLAALAQDGATNGQVVEWNGSAWVAGSIPSSVPGGSNGQIQYNNSGAFGGAPNSSISGSGAVVLGIGTNGSPVSTTALTVNGSSGANHIQDWFSQNEGFVVAHLDFNGVASLQGAVISNTINFATAALQVHGGGSGSPDIAQFFTATGSSPSNTKVVWVDFNGNLNILEGLKDSAASSGTSGQFLGSTGTATAWSAVDFSQLSGSLAIAQINSKQGNGSKVQLSTGTTNTGDVATYDANGNVISSGTLLSSLAPLASPTFTGIVSASHIQATSGGDLLVDATGTDGVRIADSGNVRGILVGGTTAGAGHIWLWSPTGSALVDVSDASVAISGPLVVNNALKDSTNSAGSSTNLLSSTGSATQWIAQTSLAINGSQVTGNIAGNAASITGSITESQVTGLTADLAAKVAKAATVDTPGLTDNVAPTTLLTAPAGMYRVSAYLYVTTADGTSSTLPKVTISWIDATSNTQTKDITALVPGTDNAIGTFDQGDVYVVVGAGNNITYQTQGYASNTPNTMAYNLRVRLEAL